MNPQHTVPVLKDGDYVLSESRAILTYLCEEFSGEKYYPKDSKMKGIIQQRLSFDLGVLYRRLGDAVYPVCFGKRENIPEEDRKSLNEAMMWMEDFLKRSKYVAGEILTIADLSLVGTVSTFEACEKGLGSLDQFPKTKEWLQIMKVELPDYEMACGKGCEQYKAWFESMYNPTDAAVTMDL